MAASQDRVVPVSLGDGAWSAGVSLPPTAVDGAVALVSSKASWSSRSDPANVFHAATMPLRTHDRARQQQVLFFAGEVTDREAAASPLATERCLQDGRQWIRYDIQVLAARAEGDRFMVPLSKPLSRPRSMWCRPSMGRLAGEGNSWALKGRLPGHTSLR
jgi:hypothetical protein